MAYGDIFHPAGTPHDVKVRGPLWAGLWSITGFYAIYWIWATAKDLSEYGKAKGFDLGQNPTMTLLAIFPGCFIVIPALVAVYRQAKRIQQAQRLAGAEQYNGWLALVLYLVFSPAYYGFVQSELNKAWAGEGGPVETSDNMPAHLDSGPSGTATTTSGSSDMPAPVAASAAPSSPEAPSPERPPGS
jgi:hypothetical protein